MEKGLVMEKTHWKSDKLKKYVGKNHVKAFERIKPDHLESSLSNILN